MAPTHNIVTYYSIRGHTLGQTSTCQQWEGRAPFLQVEVSGSARDSHVKAGGDMFSASWEVPMQSLWFRIDWFTLKNKLYPNWNLAIEKT